MAFIDVVVRGTLEEIDHVTLLLQGALRIHRTDDVPDIHKPGQTVRYVTIDTEQTLPMRPIDRSQLKRS